MPTAPDNSNRCVAGLVTRGSVSESPHYGALAASADPWLANWQQVSMLDGLRRQRVIALDGHSSCLLSVYLSYWCVFCISSGFWHDNNRTGHAYFIGAFLNLYFYSHKKAKAGGALGSVNAMNCSGHESYNTFYKQTLLFKSLGW